MTLHVLPVSCGECGDYGVDQDGKPCVCGGPLRSEQYATLRRHGWFPIYDPLAKPLFQWRLFRILDDETDDRGPALSTDSVPYSRLDDAVQALCGSVE